MTKDEALKMCLEYIETDAHERKYVRHAIKEALAQPEQEPVATLWQHGETGRTRITMPNDITDCDARWFKAADLYTTPPQRKPLTDEEIAKEFYKFEAAGAWYQFARAIEAAHGIKGEA